MDDELPPPLPPNMDDMMISKGVNTTLLQEFERLQNEMITTIKRNQETLCQLKLVIKNNKYEIISGKATESPFMKILNCEERGPLIFILQYCNPVEIFLNLIYVSKTFYDVIHYLVEKKKFIRINYFYGSLIFPANVSDYYENIMVQYCICEKMALKFIKYCCWNERIDGKEGLTHLVCEKIGFNLIGEYYLLDFLILMNYYDSVKYILENFEGLDSKYLSSRTLGWSTYNNKRVNRAKLLKLILNKFENIYVSGSILCTLCMGEEFQFVRELYLNKKIHSEDNLYYQDLVFPMVSRLYDENNEEKSQEVLEFVEFYNKKIRAFNIGNYVYELTREENYRNKTLSMKKFSYLLTLNGSIVKLNYKQSCDIYESIMFRDDIDKKFRENAIEFLRNDKRETSFDRKVFAYEFLKKGEVDHCLKYLGLDCEFLNTLDNISDEKVCIYKVVDDLKDVEKLVRAVGIGSRSICSLMDIYREEYRVLKPKLDLLWDFFYNQEKYGLPITSQFMDNLYYNKKELLLNVLNGFEFLGISDKFKRFVDNYLIVDKVSTIITEEVILKLCRYRQNEGEKLTKLFKVWEKYEKKVDIQKIYDSLVFWGNRGSLFTYLEKTYGDRILK